MSQSSARQVTLRGIPDPLYHELRSEAKRRGTSVNKILLHRLHPGLQEKTEGACAELLPLAGTWSKKKAQDFKGAAKGHRRIDKGLWS